MEKVTFSRTNWVCRADSLSIASGLPRPVLCVMKRETASIRFPELSNSPGSVEIPPNFNADSYHDVANPRLGRQGHIGPA